MLTAFRALSIAPARAFSTTAVVAMAGKRRVIDPTLPKIPKVGDSPYVSFFKEFFPREKNNFVGDNGKIKLTELAAAAGAAWKNLGQSGLEAYNARSAESRAQANEAYKAFYSELSPETIRAIEKATGKPLRKPGGKRAFYRAQNERPGNPGKPLSSFFYMMREMREAAQDGTANTLDKERALAKAAGERWRSMTEEAKKVYQDKATAAKEAYQEWEKTLTK